MHRSTSMETREMPGGCTEPGQPVLYEAATKSAAAMRDRPDVSSARYEPLPAGGQAYLESIVDRYLGELLSLAERRRLRMCLRDMCATRKPEMQPLLDRLDSKHRRMRGRRAAGVPGLERND